MAALLLAALNFLVPASVTAIQTDERGFIFSPEMMQATSWQPDAKVTFTFDDGSKNIYEKALPIFSGHNLPAVFYGETGPLNSGEPWIMTWDQVKNLQNLYGWEIGSHTITHPYLTKVSDQKLIHELRDSKAAFAQQGIQVKSFATPYGDYDARVLSAIARFYESHRAAWGGPNIWPTAYNDYEILTKEITNTTSPSTVKSWIDTAIINKQWLVLLLHDVVDTMPQPYEYNVNDLREIVNYVATQTVKVTTISGALRYSSQTNLIKNYTFSSLDASGWALNWRRGDSVNISIDAANHGNVFGQKNSLKIVAGTEQREAQTTIIPVENSADYILRMYQNVRNLTAGGWAVWVDEFNDNGFWVSGKWLGGNYANFVGYRYYGYRPSSLAVKKIQISVFTEENSRLTLYADSVEFKKPSNFCAAPFSESQEPAVIEEL